MLERAGLISRRKQGPGSPLPGPGRPSRPGHPGHVTTQVTDLSYLHSRDITYAILCQGPYDQSIRYRDFMGWDMPWYSAQGSLTVYGRQEAWEDAPPGWPQQCSITRTAGGPPDWPPVPAWPGGRPIAQWPRLQAGRSDDAVIGH